jgi:hypothetical protein
MAEARAGLRSTNSMLAMFHSKFTMERISELQEFFSLLAWQGKQGKETMNTREIVAAIGNAIKPSATRPTVDEICTAIDCMLKEGGEGVGEEAKKILRQLAELANMEE